MYMSTMWTKEQSLQYFWRLVLKILVLEDNINLCNFIKNSLENEGYVVKSFYDGNEVVESLNEGFGCFILDINVPSIDGISILETIRVYYKDTPVIIISSNHDLEKIQASYEFGCDDYIKKPFLMYELIHKVNKLCQKDDAKIALIDGFIFDKKNRTLFDAKGLEVKLTRKELLFTELIIKNNSNITTFSQIEDFVWEGHPTTLTNIRGLVKRLRKKIPKDMITIVKGIGYKLKH